ncbi:hypothetical protein BDZ91DRAFT_799656 [Kalaharituber pfeilii]|nr:hypothetical protein BDZ91DRAFT_799656 [Kalaharituber pfeilii]
MAGQLRRLEESLTSIEEKVKKRNREVEARREAEKALAKVKALEEKDQAPRKKSEKDAQEAVDRERQRLDIVQAARIAANEVDMELKRKELAVYDIKKKVAQLQR